MSCIIDRRRKKTSALQQALRSLIGVILSAQAISAADLTPKTLTPAVAATDNKAQFAELHEVRTTRDPSGNVTREEHPIEEHSGAGENDGCGLAEGILRAFLSVLFSPAPDSSSSSNIAVEPPLSTGRGPSVVRVESGYVYSRIFSSLESQFTSSSFTQLHWDGSLKLRSSGAEATVLYGIDDFFFFGLNAGGFAGAYRANTQDQNGIHVHEDISHSGGWGSAVLRLYPVHWLAVEGNLGVVGYGLHTDAITNAPGYIYQGFDGTHAAALIGLGGRLETPWQAPLKLYVGGRYWWTGGSSRPTIETGIAQFETGLSWKFDLPS